MAHTRAVDDLQTIRARIEELRREGERADYAETIVRSVRLSLCRAIVCPAMSRRERPIGFMFKDTPH